MVKCMGHGNKEKISRNVVTLIQYMNINKIFKKLNWRLNVLTIQRKIIIKTCISF